MRFWAMTAAGACLLAMTMSAGIGRLLAANASYVDGQRPIVLAQADEAEEGNRGARSEAESKERVAPSHRL